MLTLALTLYLFMFSRLRCSGGHNLGTVPTPCGWQASCAIKLHLMKNLPCAGVPPGQRAPPVLRGCVMELALTLQITEAKQ